MDPKVLDGTERTRGRYHVSNIGHPLIAAAVFWVLPAAGIWLGCGDQRSHGGSSNQNNVNWTPVVLDPGEFTYELTESPQGLPLWTTSSTHKVVTNERPPDDSRSGLTLFAARNEFEPVQLLMGPGSGGVTVQVEPFSDLGAGQRVNLAQIGYESGWAEHLLPVTNGDHIALSDDRPEGLWITVYVPPNAPAGNHETTLTLTPDGGAAVTIPIRLTVFDFALPDRVGFATQLNVSISDLIPEGGTVDDAKAMLLRHRFTPKSVTWPSGFRWNITWDNPKSTDRCETFWDEPDEPDAYAIRWLAPRYMLGKDWIGEGFPNAMIFQFVDNSTPRPATFCGIDRGDQYGTTAYNAKWSQFLTALQAYLDDHGLLEKAYYYVQNEPQDAADAKLAAYLCRLTKAAAPNLRIAISEEPKPEIAEDPEGGCGYDVWIAHVRAYRQDYAWKRQQDFGEQVWFYSLDQDPDPYFNPTRIDAQGMNQRIIPWVAWHYRASGWAYYDFGRFFDGPRPTIRAELFREGFEDYEYLLLAAGGPPHVDEANPLDSTVDSAASSLTSWTRNADALMVLRRELGRYIEGSRSTLPVLEIQGSNRPRGAYSINFQDPAGQPTADPLVVDATTYLKVGWQPWNDQDELGWYGEHVTDPSIALYGYDDTAGYSEVQKSYLYDDYGRDSLFEFGIENGRYLVTVGVGRPARGYPNDPHNVTIEGQDVLHDWVTTDSEPVHEATAMVDLTDSRLSVEFGGRSDLTGDWAYTFAAYLWVEPVE
ncbi:MAG: hypothetical protein J7M25_13100 [Deltaproteobacteria bacterium]|nr:hypothetical protein [Deltaproteobacteria bacterium]